MEQYLDMLEHVMENGEDREDRTGTGTIGTFGYQTRYDLSKGFPLLTTKNMEKLFPKIYHELMWFIKGETNIRYLIDRGVNIWNEDAYRWYKTQIANVRDFAPKHLIHISLEEYIHLIKTNYSFAKEYGDLGKIYGKQWTDFGGHEEQTPLGEEYIYGINQLDEVIKLLKEDPYSRRILVSAWNPFDQKEMALPPCHILFQFYVSNSGKLSCQMYQRSADLFLGVPFNIASYALLTHKIAYLCNLGVGEFIHTFGDLHIYKNHMEQVKTQVQREPMPLPRLEIEPEREIKKLTDFTLEDFTLIGYESHGKLTGKVSVGK